MAGGRRGTAKIVLLSFMIVVICTTWLFVGTLLARVLRDARRSRIVNVALAIALVLSTALAILH